MTKLNLNDFWAFNIEKTEWEKPNVHGNIPSGRWGAGLSYVSPSKMIIFGGIRHDKYCPAELIGVETDPITVAEQTVIWWENRKQETIN